MTNLRCSLVRGFRPLYPNRLVGAGYLGLLFVLAIVCGQCPAQAAGRTRHVFLITSDGLRPQEVFSGADPALLNQEAGGFTNEPSIAEARDKYWRETPAERREALMPFFWSMFAKQGQVFGDASRGSQARVTNLRHFSYPGYNEMLVGWPDPGIISNAEIPNRNVTVFEWLHQKEGFRDRVSVYSAWSVMHGIINRERCGFPVMAGWRPLPLPPRNEREKLLNELIAESTRAGHPTEVFDPFVFHAAVEQIQIQRPRLMMVSFLETDYWGHQGRYDRVLDSARRYDSYVQRLWELVQSMPEYANATTFILTTDHGRGGAPVEWKSHGANTPGADNIWMAVLGPDTAPLGARENIALVTQAQVAATIAALLGEDYPAAASRAAPPIADVLAAPAASPAAISNPTREPGNNR